MRMFIPEMERNCSLTYLKSISIPHQIEWSLRTQMVSLLETFGVRALLRWSRQISDWSTLGESSEGLFSRWTATFLNDFLKIKGLYPANNFHTFGWICLPTRCRGVEWLVSCSQILKLFSRILDCTGPSEMYNIVFFIASPTYLASWRCTILSLRRSLILLVSSALFSTRCSKSLYYRLESCHMRR